MDKLRIYWPVVPVLFNGKGIVEAWRDEFLKVAPFTLTDNPDEADAAFFGDDDIDTTLLSRLPIVCMFWGYYHERFKLPEFTAWAQERVSRMAQCTKIVVPSFVTYYQLCQFGLQGEFLPAGVDTDLLDSSPIPSRRKMQVLFLSRIVPHKHLEILIKAMSMLEPKVLLVVSGPGDTGEYEGLAHNLNVPISFHNLSDTEKVRALRESAILVHPSEYEGFSLPPLEALYCGTPVAVFDIPQHRHLLQGCARFFHDEEGLGQLLADMLTNYERELEIAQVGREMVRVNCTLTKASERLARILYEAIRDFLGEKMREEPENILTIYNADHRRNWAYNAQHMDPSWFRHWRLQHVLTNVVGKKVLDIGASSGTYTVALAQAGYDVTWFDHSEVAREQAESLCRKFLIRDRVKFVVGDAHNLPFEDSEFDTVWMGETIEHVFNPEKVLSEAMRVIRVGGKLIISTPIGWHHHDPLHLREWTRESIQNLLAPYSAFIEEIAEEGTDPSCFFVTAEKK